jgi:hypothetical protein
LALKTDGLIGLALLRLLLLDNCYVSMVAWFECASDAEIVLFKNIFFTRNLPNGMPLWTDRLMEWVMKSLRTFLKKQAWLQ